MTRPSRSKEPPNSRPASHVPRAVASGSDWPLRLSVVFFALSGFSALVYEIVWFQMLELVVGSSAISLGILLAIYMGGLCLGSLLLPRLVPPGALAFRVYALLELGIGLLALLVLVEVPLLRSLYMGSGGRGVGGVLVRALIAGLCLLPPTILMGAALPAVARWVEASARGVGWLGLLYASNTMGAIVGCLLAGFYLLRVHDLATATAVAALANGLVALASFALLGRLPAPAIAPHDLRAPAPRAVAPWPVYLAIGLSGFCALGGEVVWTRLISLLLGGTVYTFSIILAVFLLGIGLGSWVGAFVSRTSSHPRRDFGICQLLIAAAVLWAATMVSRSLPYWPIAPSLAGNPWIVFQLDVVRCLWAILPVAALWGASFPLALAASVQRGQDPGRLVGGIYAANTVGALAGALVFTFVVVPVFGTRVAQQVMVALAVLSGVAVLASAAGAPRSAPRLALAGLLVMAGAAAELPLVLAVPPRPGELVAYGRALAFRLGVRDPRTNALVGLPRLLYVGEGLNESVAVSDDGRVRTYHVSGKIEASTAVRDMRLQSMLGNIPALVHPNPRSVLVVGFGSGVTAGTFVLYPSVERIVICEIEPLVAREVSRYFRAENHDVFTDPRVEIVYDDARHYLLTTREKFDVISSDPIHPWVRGSAALYSHDYFDLIRDHLNPGGVVSQWIPLYQSSERTVKCELATFFSSFPGASVWANNDRGLGYDVVLLGGLSRSVIDLDQLEARLLRPDHAKVARFLGELGYASPVDLLATYTSRESDLAGWLAGAEINRDAHLRLQYQAGLESYIQNESDIYSAMSEFRIFPEDLFVGSERLKQELRNSRGAGPGTAP